MENNDNDDDILLAPLLDQNFLTQALIPPQAPLDDNSIESRFKTTAQALRETRSAIARLEKKSPHTKKRPAEEKCEELIESRIKLTSLQSEHDQLVQQMILSKTALTPSATIKHYYKATTATARASNNNNNIDDNDIDIGFNSDLLMKQL